MVTWLCIEPNRVAKTRRIMEALAQGSAGRAKVCFGAPPRGEPFVIWGHRWLAEEIVPRAIRDGTEWWLVDNGYWMPARGEAKGYYSLTYRGLSPILLERPDMNRLPLAMAPWRQTDGYVLLALPGEHYGRMIGADIPAWTRGIVGRIRARTKREIRVRDKGSQRSLADDLIGAKLLVTHSSKVAVDAVIAGVPVIVEPTNPAASAGSTDFADIEAPTMPDRAQWWASLMCQNYTLDEMRSGLAWRWMERVKEQADGLRLAAL